MFWGKRETFDVRIVVSNESVLVGNHFHLVLNSQVFSEVVAVPQNVGTTKLLMKMCSWCTNKF